MKYNISFTQGMFLRKNSEEGMWNLLQKLYTDNYLNAELSDKVKIPKIIHQIWLGGRVPSEYQILEATWKKYHPDWEYHLWTDENIKELKLTNQEIFRKTKNIGAKSDILRYEILYKFGGLYVDTDFECLKSFDDIHRTCDFYAGLLTYSSPHILIGLIGCAPHSDIIKKNIEQIKIASTKSTPDQIFNATGPAHFTRCFFEAVKLTNQKCVIFPPTFFYPSPNFTSGMAHDIQKEYIREESYAIHYWHISWTKNKNTVLYLVKKSIKYLLPYGLIKLFNDRRNINHHEN